MSNRYNFIAEILDSGNGGGYVIIPFDVENGFGKKRVKIKARIDGEPYRGTLVRMGTPHHILIVLKEIRAKIGKSFGDQVSVEIEEDLEPRQVDLPEDFQKILQENPPALEFFNRLSYTHQKEYVCWITEAKREQTRHARVHRAIEMLDKGVSGL